MCCAQDVPWYQEWFNEDYLEVYGHRDAADAKRAVTLAERELALSRGDRVLDLCCGNGRHSLELVRRGFRVVALDLSYALLRSGAKKAREEALRVGFVQADARRIALREGFDAVLNFFTSFGYFEADDDNTLMLENISRVLKEGGKFLIDYLNAAHVVKNLVPKTVWEVGSAKVCEVRWIDVVRRTVSKTITIERNGVEKGYSESVRLYGEDELRNMLTSCGLRVAKGFGDYDGSSIDVGRPRLILVGAKA
jgi:ubiquinone/menaquinone biosynthesis C-methylase UbiE